jgi:hypothetical protein
MPPPSGCSNAAAVSMTVSQNVPSHCRNDTFSFELSVNVSCPVLLNDNDPDDGFDLSTLLIITPPQFGTADISNNDNNQNGVIEYAASSANVSNDVFMLPCLRSCSTMWQCHRIDHQCHRIDHQCRQQTTHNTG